MAVKESDITQHWFNSPDITGSFRSSCGKTVHIVHRGYENTYDGPDISQAIVTYDGLRFFGNIEFHTQTEHWYQHKHHKDERYNNVILHVVSSSKKLAPVKCKNGNLVPTVFLPIAAHTEKAPQLSCSGTITSIHPKIIDLEIRKSRSRYFTQLLERCAQQQHGKGVLQNFTSSLIYSVFDVLGIPANRVFMQQQSLSFLSKHGFSISEADRPIVPVNKRVRRPNNPHIRQQQAQNIAESILVVSKNDWAHQNPQKLFETIIQKAPGLSYRVKGILWGVAFLPSLYMLANNIYDLALMKKIFELWNQSEMQLPASYLSLLQQSDWPKSFQIPDPGLIFKIKIDCLKKRCEECEIFHVGLSA